MAIKAKNITIGVRTLDRGLDNFVEAAETLLKGEPVKKQRGVYFENLDSFRKVLTEKRLALLHTVKQHNPDTIHELARLLGRDMKMSVTISNTWLNLVWCLSTRLQRAAAER